LLHDAPVRRLSCQRVVQPILLIVGHVIASCGVDIYSLTEFKGGRGRWRFSIATAVEERGSQRQYHCENR
jgi:hypothetical protein